MEWIQIAQKAQRHYCIITCARVHNSCNNRTWNNCCLQKFTQPTSSKQFMLLIHWKLLLCWSNDAFQLSLKEKKEVYCGRQEEPAILISRLLLRMRRMCVGQHSFGLPLRIYGIHSERTLITRVWTFYHSLSDHACFDHLSRETREF